MWPPSLTDRPMNVVIGSRQCVRFCSRRALGGNATSTTKVRVMSEAQETELTRLERECRQLQEQVSAQAWELNLLRARFARYETALRGSQVTVYTQDSDLRYTSVSNPVFGRAVEDILGRTDAEILNLDGGAAMIAVKREVLASGEVKRAEMPLEDPSGIRWHDLHMEPLRNEVGDVVGLTCASVDVTERKEGEAHLRLLLRELTHRSKNLLAVIQAMARQTARHTGSVESFLTQFGARLQALAASHDLLVRESWYGASLGELIRSQLATILTDRPRRCRSKDLLSLSSPKRRKIWASRSMSLQSMQLNLGPCQCRAGVCPSLGVEVGAWTTIRSN